jgi:transposase-like protein
MANQELMTFVQFQKEFNSEEACHKHLFQKKWEKGFECPKCKHHHAYEIKTRKLPLYECALCHHQTTVTVGTILEKTRTDLYLWFSAIYLVAHDKRGVSAVLLAQELEISYKTAWLMLHKIRKAMADRDAPYKLTRIVELDDFFIGAPTENGKRGRGTDKNQVLIAVSKNKKGYPLYVKMEVITDMKGPTVLDFTTRFIQEGSHLQTDAHRSFLDLANKGYSLDARKLNLGEDPNHLKWIHTAISNLKAVVTGTFHGLDGRHLQAYLDEFCYRFNRRNFVGQLFNRVLKSCVSTSTITQPELTA